MMATQSNYIIPTKRLVLSLPEEKDIDRLVTLAGDARISATTATMPYPYEQKNAEDWIAMASKGVETGDRYIFALRLKESLDLIGGIGLHLNILHNRAEMGYWVGHPYWNQGYMSEAASAMIDFGFRQLELHRIYAHHITTNIASGKVMIHNGMQQEGLLRGHLYKEGTYHDLALYGLMREDYLTRNHTPHKVIRRSNQYASALSLKLSPPKITS
ncbi:MAG: GNAT family N-acetyltransferase [Saprospiraceae bacterium]